VLLGLPPNDLAFARRPKELTPYDYAFWVSVTDRPLEDVGAFELHSGQWFVLDPLTLIKFPATAVRDGNLIIVRSTELLKPVAAISNDVRSALVVAERENFEPALELVLQSLRFLDRSSHGVRLRFSLAGGAAMTYGCIAGGDGYDTLQRPSRPECHARPAAARVRARRRLAFPGPHPARRWKHVLDAAAISPARNSSARSWGVVHRNRRRAVRGFFDALGGREPPRGFSSCAGWL